MPTPLDVANRAEAPHKRRHRGEPRPTCQREGCGHTPRRSQYAYCSAVCNSLDSEMNRATEVLPQAEQIGVPNTAEQWTLLVEAADAWTKYLDARRDMGGYLGGRRARRGLGSGRGTPAGTGMWGYVQRAGTLRSEAAHTLRAWAVRYPQGAYPYVPARDRDVMRVPHPVSKSFLHFCPEPAGQFAKPQVAILV